MFSHLIDVNLLRIGMMLVAATIAVVIDARERRIPNALTLPLAAAGLGIGVAGGSVLGLALALAGLLVGTGFFLLPVAKLGWGMGDLKLAAALGALGGPLFILWTGLYALVAGGVIGLVWLRQRGQLARVVGGIQRDVRAGNAPAARSGLAIPYAGAIAAGMLVALLVFPGLPA